MTFHQLGANTHEPREAANKKTGRLPLTGPSKSNLIDQLQTLTSLVTL